MSQLFAKQMGERSPSDYLIRVDRMPASGEQVLNDGSRVSFTPVKIEGARVPLPVH